MVRMEFLKVLIVGDGAVGKTALILRYVNGKFIGDYLPTIADNFRQNIAVRGITYAMNLCDTAGQEGYARIRALSYPNTDIVLCCYSCDSRDSFNNWLPEIRHYLPDTPVCLVGLKTDLRDGLDSSIAVSQEMGNTCATNHHLHSFLECSAKADSDEHFHQMFTSVVEVYLENERKIKEEEAAKKSMFHFCSIV